MQIFPFQPHHQPAPNPKNFTIIRRLDNDGGLNAGIYLVQDTITRKEYVKKAFLPRDVQSGHALREIQALMRLQHCPNVSKIICYEVNAFAPHKAAMYLQYYKQGTLADLIKRHSKAGVPIPRPFVWKAFYCLADILFIMQTGDPKPNAPRQPWNWIIHRDIHPGNVFLDGGSPIQYPRVILGDFGCSIDKQCYYPPIAMTPPGYLKPRGLVSRWNANFVTPDHPASEFKSDVYQVALVIVAALRLSFLPLHWVKNDSEFPAGKAREDEMFNRILKQCLERDVRRRIGAVELRNELMKNVGRMKERKEELLLM